MTLQEQLKELDAKSTQGEWEASWDKDGDGTDPLDWPILVTKDDTLICGTEGFYTDHEIDRANATFITHLVNAYRSGQLVPLPEVEEQIAAARQAALEAAAKVAQAKGPTHAYIAQAIRNLAKGKE